jgi:TonB family protein
MSLSFLAFLLLPGLSRQLQKNTCDHPTPPEGMHYVCAPRDSCNCRLEKDEAKDHEAAAKPNTSPAGEVCLSQSLKHFVAPVYPAAARAARKQGTVTAQLVVDPSGQFTIKLESGEATFTEPVVVALKNWRFGPSASQQTFTATFTFALAGNPTANAITGVSGSSPLNLVITATPPLPTAGR